jgi:hypothetical protein
MRWHARSEVRTFSSGSPVRRPLVLQVRPAVCPTDPAQPTPISMASASLSCLACSDATVVTSRARVATMCVMADCCRSRHCETEGRPSGCQGRCLPIPDCARLFRAAVGWSIPSPAQRGRLRRGAAGRCRDVPAGRLGAARLVGARPLGLRAPPARGTSRKRPSPPSFPDHFRRVCRLSAASGLERRRRRAVAQLARVWNRLRNHGGGRAVANAGGTRRRRGLRRWRRGAEKA